MTLRTDGSDGGAAFPRQDEEYDHGATGMTLRDYFAAKAMAVLLSKSNTLGEVEGVHFASYKVADKMLSARDAN